MHSDQAKEINQNDEHLVTKVGLSSSRNIPKQNVTAVRVDYVLNEQTTTTKAADSDWVQPKLMKASGPSSGNAFLSSSANSHEVVNCFGNKQTSSSFVSAAKHITFNLLEDR